MPLQIHIFRQQIIVESLHFLEDVVQDLEVVFFLLDLFKSDPLEDLESLSCFLNLFCGSGR
jgi:hypothetical protein